MRCDLIGRWTGGTFRTPGQGGPRGAQRMGLRLVICTDVFDCMMEGGNHWSAFRRRRGDGGIGLPSSNAADRV